jgi:hypothetical protein
MSTPTETDDRNPTLVQRAITQTMDSAYSADSASMPEKDSGYAILKHGSSTKLLALPILLLGILILAILPHDEITLSQAVIALPFIICSLWFFFFHMIYRLRFNDTEIILHRFLMKDRHIALSDIRKAVFFSAERNLYITDNKGFVRVPKILIGYNEFEKRLEKDLKIERH